VSDDETIRMRAVIHDALSEAVLKASDALVTIREHPQTPPELRQLAAETLRANAHLAKAALDQGDSNAQTGTARERPAPGRESAPGPESPGE
jgi:hypothetical protein